MADLKISQLTAITTLTPATDVLPVVDVTGTTKKITTNQILGSGGTATLASATITGDLTVHTSTLKVDSANNRVGIGTASPTETLHVSNGNIRMSINQFLYLYYGSATNYASLGADSSGSVQVFTGISSPANRFQIANDGICTWSNVGGTSGTAMTLNSTGLGVGGVPTGTAPTVLVEGIAGTYAKFNSKVGAKTWSAGYRSGTLQYEIQEDGTERFVIANGGNVGIGNTPSAWGSASYSVAALQNPAGAFWNYQTSIVSMIQNAFYNNSAQYIYKNNGFASEYYQSSGQHIWRTVASGTAGNVITFTQAMTLAASGKLLVGWTTAPTASASLFADGIQCTNTSGGGGYANLAIAGGGIGIYTHTGVAGSETYTERVRVKGTGQVRFVPLAADPAGAEAGDVYYNSVSNRLKYYNGTAWTLI